MNSGENPIELIINIDNDDASLEKLDQIARSLNTQLRREANQLSIKQLDLANTDEQNDGSKSASDVAAVGAIILSLLPDALPNLIDWLKEWSMRDQKNVIKLKKQVGKTVIELEVSGKTSVSEVKRYLDLISKNMH